MKRDIVEIIWSLRAKFKIDNPKDKGKIVDHPREIIAIHAKRGSQRAAMTSTTL